MSCAGETCGLDSTSCRVCGETEAHPKVSAPKYNASRSRATNLDSLRQVDNQQDEYDNNQNTGYIAAELRLI